VTAICFLYYLDEGVILLNMVPKFIDALKKKDK